jgi:indole-3-glycerol phosphate synthase
VPVLRKDFVVSPYQLYEARANGADAVLLIAAVLSEGELRSLIKEAEDLGLDALVEVHDADELAASVSAGATIVGVNNRDLRSLRVSLDVSRELSARIPRGVVAVSESGLKTAEDLAQLSALGYGAFLIGERFMVEPDPGTALAALLAAKGAPGGDTRGGEVAAGVDAAADARR